MTNPEIPQEDPWWYSDLKQSKGFSELLRYHSYEDLEKVFSCIEEGDATAFFRALQKFRTPLQEIEDLKEAILEEHRALFESSSDELEGLPNES